MTKTKTRTAATIVLAAAAAMGLAACGTTHRAAVVESVVVSRPNTVSALGFTLDGKPITIQHALRGGPILTEASADNTASLSNGRTTLVGTSEAGCHPLPAPIPLAKVRQVVDHHAIVEVAFDSLPKVAQESLTFVSSKGRETRTANGSGVYNVLFQLRGVRIGSATARTERYRIGPDEPGVLFEDVIVDEGRTGWHVLPRTVHAPGIVTVARCSARRS